MALIESLKAFYKDNVEDINKLNDADSVLEVLRAKYGDYKGSNIEEYIKELVNNDITPSGSTPTGTITITENGEGIDVSSYAYADVNVSGGGDYKIFKVTVTPRAEGDQFGLDIYSNDDSLYEGMFVMSKGFGNSTPISEESVTYDLICFGDSVHFVYPSNTVTNTSGDIEYDEENSYYTIFGDCTVTGWVYD